MAEDGAARLRSARRAAGLTQLDLATALGLSTATVSRAESGAARLSAEHVARAAELVGVSTDDLHDVAAIPVDTTGTIAGQFVRGSGDWRVFEQLELVPSLAAALDCFLELGYHGSSVRDIAGRAGMSVPGLYHHYDSKQAMLVAIMDVTMSDLVERCEAAREEGATPVERFAMLVECLALMHSYRRELGFIGASEMRSVEPDDRARLAQVRADTGRMLADEVLAIDRDGGLANPYPEDAARAVVTMLVGIANWYHAEGPLSPEEIARQYVVHAKSLIGLRST